MDRHGVAIGALGHPARAIVGPHGRVSPCGLPWSLDWWLHDGTRWRLPSREVTVRQRLVDRAPVVETTLRGPGGDVASAAYAIAGGVAVVEVHNRTPVPVAVALVVGAEFDDAPEGIATIDWDGGRVVHIDDRPSLLFARPPARAAGRAMADGDLLDMLGLDAVPWRGVRCPQRRAGAAFVFPLPRTTSARVIVALDGAALDPAWNTAAAPRPEDVARGWDRVVAAALTVDLPPSRLGDAVAVCVRRLALAQDTDPPAAAVAAAARWGLTARAPTAGVPAPVASAGSGLVVPGSGPGTAPRPSDLRATLARAAGELGAGDPSGWRRLQSVLDSASSVWTWPTAGPVDDVLVTAAFLDAVRALLVRETDDGLVLCALWPDEWGHGALDVRGAPTSAGRLSFSVRWHGPRPALLWELAGPPVHMSAPGLDPAWTASDATGEALLQPR